MNIEKIADRLGYEKEGNVFHKQVAEFHAMLVLSQEGFKQMFNVVFFLENEVDNDFVKHAQSTLNYPHIMGKGRTLTLPLVALSKKMSATDELVLEAQGLMNNLSAYLIENNFHQQDKCIFCHNENGIEEEVVYTDFQQLYVPMHKACYNVYLENLKKQALDENKKMGRLPLGILLAIVGAIIGLVPNFILLLISGGVYAILYALMPVCAFYGYKLSGAPQTKIMTIVSVVASLFVVLGFDVILYVLASMEKGELLVAELFSDLLIDAVFLGLGTFISWRLITNTKSRKLKEMQK